MGHHLYIFETTLKSNFEFYHFSVLVILVFINNLHLTDKRFLFFLFCPPMHSFDSDI